MSPMLSRKPSSLFWRKLACEHWLACFEIELCCHHSELERSGHRKRMLNFGEEEPHLAPKITTDLPTDMLAKPRRADAVSILPNAALSAVVRDEMRACELATHAKP